MKSVALNQEKTDWRCGWYWGIISDVNEALNNYITLMNFAYVLSRETDQSNRMDHTTVTDKHLGGLHLRKKINIWEPKADEDVQNVSKHFIRILLHSL